MSNSLNRRISVAPMLDYTNKHCRFFLRLISKHAVLYTEMVTTGAILKGDPQRFLTFNSQEHPLALQLGGSNPQALAECALIAEDYGYNEINLNVGCPSDKVQAGRFGACLMAEPDLVADCVAAMKAKVNIPVTVKHRIGIDDSNTDKFLNHFIETVAQAGCECFIVHARKAWLKGLNPKQNRTVPPLDYERVYQLKQQFPQLEIIINGGIESYSDIDTHLSHVDGVMIGRAIIADPYLYAYIDKHYYDDDRSIYSREAIVELFQAYLQQQIELNHKPAIVLKSLMGLYQGQSGAKAWRRQLSQGNMIGHAAI